MLDPATSISIAIIFLFTLVFGVALFGFWLRSRGRIVRIVVACIIAAVIISSAYMVGEITAGLAHVVVVR